MKKNYFKKSNYLFIIMLFISLITTSSINGDLLANNNSLIINFNENRLMSENSMICGFITDYETGAPILYAYIRFFIKDFQGNYDDYEAMSDENGYYIIENVDPGECFEYGADADGYHFYWGGNFYIGENETVWVNMSLFPLQPKTSKIYGYLFDNYSGEPISNTWVIVHWDDIYGQLNYCGDITDEDGFYSIDLGAGKFVIYTDAEDHIDQGLGPINISDNETVWLNFSLSPEIVIEIVKPVNGIYFNNKMILPFYFPLIIGSIDIKIDITFYEGDPIDYVELLIDNISKYNFTSEPYIYNWTEKTHFKFQHTIKVIAHRYGYFETSIKLQVWKIF